MGIAVITGASAGLGAEFVRSVIERYPGLDEIWAIARREDRLKDLANRYPGAHIRPFSLDLTSDVAYEKIGELLKEEKPSIDILINDAGYGMGGRFEEMSPDKTRFMIDLNMTALTMMSHICFPYMKKGSFVILVSSTSAFAPCLNQAVYSASKAYVMYLGKALHGEMRSKGINVLTLCPGNMETELNPRVDGKRVGLPYLDMRKLTRRTLIRAEKGKGFYTPGLIYKCYRLASKIFPNVFMQNLWWFAHGSGE